MATRTPSGGALDRRTLNRALLARQHLLERVHRPPLELIEHLVGLQAQAPAPPYYALWSRIVGFDPDVVGRALEGRVVVRIAVMRSTIHLVTADDALWLRPLVQPVLDRGLQSVYGKHLVGLDRAEVAAVGRALLEEKALTNAALAPLLAERWPDRDAKALGNAVRAWVPLVQPPPRAVWGRSGAAAHTPIESWLGRPLVGGTLDQLVSRYLAAFGPASVKDAQTWCGLTRLEEVFERLRPSLRTFRDERGVELFDLPDAPRPEPETPAPPRFLPEYDNVLLSHADRARVMGDRPFSLLMSPNGIQFGTLLVDGFVRGQWRVLRGDGVATLRIAPFEPLSPSEVDEVVEEGAALIRFAAPELQPGEVTFGDLPAKG